MREIPGVNVVQMSARDFNVTPRAATNVPAASQLVMIDGRPINQDYYGYVAWDFMPMGLGEVKQIEVLRGAASSVWGDYAMNGVVNILTKSPREMAGSTLTIGAGSFDRMATYGIAGTEACCDGNGHASAGGAVQDGRQCEFAAGCERPGFYRHAGNGLRAVAGQGPGEGGLGNR